VATPSDLIIHYSDLAFRTRITALAFVGAAIGGEVAWAGSSVRSAVRGAALILIVASLAELNRRYTWSYLSACRASAPRANIESEPLARAWDSFIDMNEGPWRRRAVSEYTGSERGDKEGTAGKAEATPASPHPFWKRALRPFHRLWTWVRSWRSWYRGIWRWRTWHWVLPSFEPLWQCANSPGRFVNRFLLSWSTYIPGMLAGVYLVWLDGTTLELHLAVVAALVLLYWWLRQSALPPEPTAYLSKSQAAQVSSSASSAGRSAGLPAT
jgi:hypothetical protein